MCVHPDYLGPGRLRDPRPDSTAYTGAIETAVEFGKRIYREAWKRSWSRAKKKAQTCHHEPACGWQHDESAFPSS
jgi:hypothetical protein